MSSSIIDFYDTSAILNGAQFKHIGCISTITLNELEHIKNSKEKDEETKYTARRFVRTVMLSQPPQFNISNNSLNQISLLRRLYRLPPNNDSDIIIDAYLYIKHHENHVLRFITADAMQYFLAIDFFTKHLPRDSFTCIYFDDKYNKDKLWKGYQIIKATDEQLNSLYSEPSKNVFKLNTNEYCIITDCDDKCCDIIKWDGKNNSNLKFKNVSSNYFGVVKPKNLQQKMMFDLLQNENIPIKLIRGQFGSGKTFLALVHALYLIQFHKYDKLIVIRNNIEVAGSQKIGALPGEIEDKLLPYLMPIADHLGDVEVLRQYISDGTIEPIHVGFLRGRNFSNSIILVDEAENLTTDNIKLILGRVAEGSTLWLLGDESQTDSDIFRKNNGIMALLRSLKGNELFGTVELQKSERSAVAQLSASIK